MSGRIETPPTLYGDTEAQLKQLTNYLYRTAELLNILLDTTGTSTGTVTQVVAAPVNVTSSSELKAIISNVANELGKQIKELEKGYERLSEDFTDFVNNGLESRVITIIEEYTAGT